MILKNAKCSILTLLNCNVYFVATCGEKPVKRKEDWTECTLISTVMFDRLLKLTDKYDSHFAM